MANHTTEPKAKTKKRKGPRLKISGIALRVPKGARKALKTIGIDFR